MPQIERPSQRRPLKDLPLSLFIHPEHLKSTAILGKKRPYSPSSVVSPSKRRLLAVEGVLSPRSPFKRAVADLQRALPSTSSPGRDLLDEFQRSPDLSSPSTRRPPPLLPFDNPRAPKVGLVKPFAPVGLGSSIQLMPYQPKPRVAEAPSTAEAELLAILAAAPKSTQVYLPGAGQGRPIRNKEDDPEEDHYPGFDIYVDEETADDSAHQEMDETKAPVDAEVEDEQDASKENQRPFDDSRGRRFSTPSLSARSSMSSLGFPPTRLGGRRRLRREVDEDAFSSDDDFL
ncbi:hypothetical protein FRC20_006665 [Serendipita sp. 405]|nr:hypothetical protein FRC20_006665 [Serendipita sp. 405]